MLKKISIYILSLILMFTILPNNIVKADSTYTQLVSGVKIKSGFSFKSGINRDVNFSSVAVFTDTNVKVNGAKRALNENETVTVKIPNGFKYMDGSTYDIYVDITTTKALSESSTWVCKTVVNGSYDCLELSPFANGYWGNDPYVTFDYKIYILDSDGNDAIDSNDIDLTAGSCWTAVNEGARPWGNDGTIYTNIPASKLQYETKVKAKNGQEYDANCWHITDGSYNKLNYYILGHGTTKESVNYQSKTVTCIEGGYIRNSESGSAEMMFGYFLSASGDDYVGYYDGKTHSITVTTDDGKGTITYSTTQDGTYTSTKPEYKDVGTYTVYYKITGDGYNGKTGSHTVTIKPLPIVISPTANDKVYDGNTNAIVNVKSSYSTGVGSEAIVLSNVKGTFDSANVGYNKTVTLSGQTGDSYTLSMLNSNGNINNYKITVNNPKASITKADIKGISAYPYAGTYDGNYHNITVTFNGEPITDSNTQGYTVKYYSDADCTQELTGTNSEGSQYGWNSGYKDVKGEYPNTESYTVYYKVTKSTDAENYNAVTGSSTVTIKRKEIKVIPTALDRQYSEGDKSATIVGKDNANANTEDNYIEVTGLNNEKIKLWNISGEFEDDIVGNDKTVKITTEDTAKKVAGVEATTYPNNYKITVENTKASIYSSDGVYVTATSYVGVYDGQYHTSTITVKKSDGITISSDDATNGYSIKYYSDAEHQNECSGEGACYTSSGLIDANTTYDNPTFTTIYYMIDFNSDNYTDQYGQFVMMIIPAEVSYTPVALNKVYDGTTDATIIGDSDKTKANGDTNKITISTGITRNGQSSSESFTIYGITGAFENASAGDGKIVNITSDGLSNIVDSGSTGFNKNNYHIVINPTTAKITSAELTSIATPYDGVYNGNVQGIAVTVNDSNGNDVTNTTTITYYTDSALTNIDYMIKDVTLDDDSNVVTRTVYYKVEKTNYKTLTGSSTVTIRPKEVEIKPSAKDKKYDGNTSATLNALGNISTGVNNEAISVTGLTGEFITADVGNNKEVLVDNRNASVSGVGDTLIKNYYLKIEDTTASIYDGSSNNTGTFLSCEDAININWTWSEAKKACVYRVGKTDTK